jgi:hypothetical protein
MTNNQILMLEQELPNVNVPDMDRWFNYAVQETIQRATEKAKVIREVIKPKEGMEKYQGELKKLQIKYSNKDENGEPVMLITDLGDGKKLERYDIPDINKPNGKFNEAINRLQKKYQADIDKYNEGLKFLEEENKDFEPFWVTVDQIPNGLMRDQMAVVFLMIKKEE